MKKLIYSLFALAMMATTFISCEDVPAPYDDPNNNQKKEGAIPYSSVNLYTGWTLHSITAEQPWSQGNSYTQATGYQNWDGSGQKSNREVEGYLISPKFNTEEVEHVKISFDQTIRYTNNVSGWKDYHKIFASSNYDGENFDKATWVEVAYVPVASPYSDWTLYTSGEIQLPDEMAGKESIYVAFWFKAPASASTTWELQNFKIEGGIAEETPEPVEETIGTADEPITTLKALELITALDNGGKSTGKAYVKGKIVRVTTNQTNFEKYGNLSYYISDDGSETNQVQVYAGDGLNGEKFQSATDIKAGDEVVVFGVLYKYVNATSGAVVPEITDSYLVKLTKGTAPDPQPSGEAKGSGTLEDPYNPVAACNAVKDLTWTDNNTYETTGEVYVKGKISRIADKGTFSESGTYGNASFYISEDGSQNDEFYCYRVLYLGNQKYTSGTDIKVGDDVIICGQLMNYRGNTPETVAGKAYLYSLNDGGGNSQPANAGSYEAPLTVTEAIALGNAKPAWVKGIIVGWVEGQSITSGAHFDATGDNVTDTNLLIAASASEKDVAKCMPVQLSRDYRSDFALKNAPDLLGKEIIISGSIETYFSVPGLKSPTYMECNGKTKGSK